MKMKVRRICALSLALSAPILATQAQASLTDGAQLNFEARNLYFNNHNRSAPKLQSNTEQWGQGFILEGISGYTDGPIGFGADAIGMLGAKLYGPQGRNGAIGLFPTDSTGNSPDTFGSASFALKARVSQSVLRAGYQQLNLPVIQSNDGRLLPSIYRGITFSSQDIADVILNAGFIDRVQGRNQDGEQKLKATGNAKAFSSGFTYAGGTWNPIKPLGLTYYYARLNDVYQQNFVGITTATSLSIGKLSTDIRYFNSQGVGAQFSGPINNNAIGGLVSYSLLGNTFGLGYQALTGSSGFPYLDPGQSVGGIVTGTTGGNSGLIGEVPLSKFKTQDEKEWVLKYSYNLSRIGLQGVAFNSTYVSGHDARTSSKAAGQNEWVRTFGLSYNVPDSVIKGVTVAWKNVTYRTNVTGNHSQDQNILLVSYKFGLVHG